MPRQRAERELFTEQEARALVGKRVRTSIAFSGVPAGTAARVIQADRSRDGYTVALEWELPTDPARGYIGGIAGEPVVVIQGGKPLVDWFTKDEFDRWITVEAEQ